MTLANKVEEFNEQIVPVARQIVHGDASTTVMTDGGPVRSLAKLIADNDARILGSGLLAEINASKDAAAQARTSAEAARDDVAVLGVDLLAQVNATKEATEGERARAEAARDAANAIGKVFATTAAGVAGTVSGQSFCVLSTDASQLIVYTNNAGAAAEVTRYYTKNYMDTIAQSVEGAVVPSLAFVDGDNNAFFVAMDDGSFGTKHVYMSRNAVRTADFSIESDMAGALSIVDEEGFVGMRVANDGGMNGSSSGGSTFNEIAERNARNLAYSAIVRSEFNSEVQRPVCKYNHFITYGQSLSTGVEGWPALSKTPKYDNLMYGDSPRPNSLSGPGFTPVGTASLKALKAVTQSPAGTAVMSDLDVAALAPGSGNGGESPDVGALNYARKMFLQHMGLASDLTRQFVSSNCGVSGRTIEALSKGASPELYLRATQAAQAVKGIAEAQGATYCVPAIVFLQGEYNYTPDYGGVTDKDGYKALLRKLRNDMVADICNGIAGQSAPPAFITYQTGGPYTRDENDMAIGQAQLELSQEEQNWYLATPTYPYTDKWSHLDSNGYRWVGQQIGKVFHRVVTLGQGWRPLSPRQITAKAREVLIDFHVPYPPLVFDRPYVRGDTVDYPSRGFKVIDEQGLVAIGSVEIASDTIVRINLARDTIGAVKVQYADKEVHNGNGCLRDSDPAIASDLYEYSVGTGQYETANVAALVGKPYPLFNWCVAFSLPAKNS